MTFFPFKLFIVILLFTETFAKPFRRTFPGQRHSRRTLPLNNPITKPLRRPEDSQGLEQITYTGNWAGGLLTAPPASSQKYTNVSGVLILPNPEKPPGLSSTTSSNFYSASAWVGIDGDTNRNTILQCGVDISVWANGTAYFDAWFEWWPGFTTYYDGFKAEAGDAILLEVVALTSSTGIGKIQNLSTNESQSLDLEAPDSANLLIQQNAEWIVEDWQQNGVDVPLVDFQNITFTNCSAVTDVKTVVTLDEATIINMASGDYLFSSVQILSETSMEILYQVAGSEVLPDDAEFLAKPNSTSLNRNGTSVTNGSDTRNNRRGKRRRI